MISFFIASIISSVCHRWLRLRFREAVESLIRGFCRQVNTALLQVRIDGAPLFFEDDPPGASCRL